VVNDTMDLLVCKEALIQTPIQEVVMKPNDFINGLHRLEAFSKLVKVWLKNFVEHVIQVVFAELEHLVPRSVSLSEESLNIALLG